MGCICQCWIVVVALLSGSALVSISVVTVRRARLVLGWVTVSGQTILILTSRLGQLSLSSFRGR